LRESTSETTTSPGQYKRLHLAGRGQSHSIEHIVTKEQPEANMNANLFKKLDVVQSEDGQSMYVDFDIDSHLARITIWDWDRSMGMCDTEIHEVASGDKVLWEHHEFGNSREFDAVMKNFTQQLSDLMNRQRAEPGEATARLAFELHLLDKNIGLDGVLKSLLAAG
jgi:hypothetical protein